MSNEPNKQNLLQRWAGYLFRGKPINGWLETLAILFGMLIVVTSLAILWVVAGILYGSVMQVFNLNTGINARPDEQLRNYALIIAAIGTAIFAFWRGIIAQQNAATAQKNLDLSEQRHFTERFIKAVELLGAMHDDKPALEQRLGAIYALERLSRESEDDHIQIMETLCAYIRQNAPSDETRWPGAILRDLERQNPEVSAKDIIVNAEFKAANKVTKFTVTQLQNARNEMPNDPCLDRWVKTLAPPREDIRTALDVIGRRSEMRRNVEKTKNYQLDLSHTCLRKANLSKKFMEGALLYGAQMESANLRGAQMDGADLFDARLERADLRGVQLEGTALLGARLERANLMRARLERADFRGARLERANLRAVRLMADLRFSQLDGAILIGAFLTGSPNFTNRLVSTRLTAAILRGSAFRYVDLSAKIADDQTDFRNSFGDGTVILPTTMQRPGHWCVRKLNDKEFFGRWRGWIEIYSTDMWELVAPGNFKDVPAIPPPEGSKWVSPGEV